MIELDVTRTRDGHVICLHDETVDRTSNGSGAALELTLAEIQGLDAGSWFSRDYEGATIPTLDEVLSSISDRALVNLEIKREAVDAEGLFVRSVCDLVHDHSMTDAVMVSSFEHLALRQALEHRPEITRGCLLDPHWSGSPNAGRIARGVGAEVVAFAASQTSLGLLASCFEHGLETAAYTVNSEKVARLLWHAGVTAVFTDHPDQLLALV